MAKGMFTQGVCLLTNGQTTIEEIEAALQERDFAIVKRVPANDNWCFGGPSFVVAFVPDANGYASVDVVNQSWPDDMGNPKTDPLIFAAWSMGWFGPFAFPRSLARASQHAWAWQPGRTIAEGHRGFIRVQMSYCFGAKDDFPIMPNDYDPLAELSFLSRMALAILQIPSVICYFNPSGEVLRDRGGFDELWSKCKKLEKLPLPLWMNIRSFKLNEKLGFMDTVGNGQLDLSDIEAIFPMADYEAGEIDYYLRNVTHYLLDLKREIHTDESIDGPGETDLTWTTEAVDKGAIEPLRRVLRLYPKANRNTIQEALLALGRSRG
jgi:hypothetical protein